MDSIVVYTRERMARNPLNHENSKISTIADLGYLQCPCSIRDFPPESSRCKCPAVQSIAASKNRPKYMTSHVGWVHIASITGLTCRVFLKMLTCSKCPWVTAARSLGLPYTRDPGSSSRQRTPEWTDWEEARALTLQIRTKTTNFFWRTVQFFSTNL